MRNTCFVVLTIVAVSLALFGSPANRALGATLTVDSTGDDSDLNPGDGLCETAGTFCTLRAAIEEANAHAGKEEIAFSIPGAGPYVIQPATALPPITEAATIDGTTQPGFQGSPVIELDGSGIPSQLDASGLVVSGGGSNVLSLMTYDYEVGIFILSDSNQVQGNIIGGTSIVGPMDNRGHGVLVNGSNNMIGGLAPGERNIIGFNRKSGVFIESGTGNAIHNTTFQDPTVYYRLAPEIDLAPAGVTFNDPGDGDQGPNGLQNFPDLLSATVDATNLTINGKLGSSANTLFGLELFAVPDTPCNFTGYGEGTIVLGSTTVQTDGSGNINFVYEVPNLGQVKAGDFITATATDPLNNTSEFSQCLILACASGFNPGVDTDLDGVGDFCDLDDDDDSLIGSGSTTRVASTGPCPTGGAAHPIFGDCVELFIGTNPLLPCAATPAENDEPVDPWPVDADDDTFVDTADIGFLTSRFGLPGTGADVRYDLNLSGFIDTGDIAYMTSRFSEACLP